MPTNPWQALKSATRAVPAVKYAVGVVGVAAAVAIIAALGIDYHLAFFGTIVMLFLMAILLLFARLAQSPDSLFHAPAVVFLWVSLLLFTGVGSALFFSIFFSYPLDLRCWVTGDCSHGPAAAPLAPQAERLSYPLTVGVIAPLTGTSAYFGRVIRNGIKLAIDEAPSKGLRNPLKLVIYDDGGNSARAGALLSQLSTQDHVTVVLGPVDSSAAAAASLEAQKLAVPVVSPSATASYLTDPPNPWFFRAITSDKRRAEDLASWVATDAKNQPLLLVYETRSEESKERGDPVLYGESVANDLIPFLNQRGVAFATATYVRDVGSPASAITPAVTHQYGAFVLLGRSVDTLVIGSELRRLNSAVNIFLLSPGKSMFAKTPGMVGIAAVTDTIIENTNDPALVAFRKRYAAAYPDEQATESIDQYATFGYDAAVIVIDALRRFVDSATSAEVHSIVAARAAVRDYISRTPADRTGLMSDGGFTANNELNFRPHRERLGETGWVEATS